MSDPQHDSYDVVVVGAGIGGAVAGAVLASVGFGVLVVEAADTPGGLVREFESDGLRWDPAVHLLLDPPHWGRLLDALGVADEVRFLQPPHLWRAVTDENEVVAPFDRDPYIEAHVEQFPGSADQVRRFLSLCAETQEALHKTLEGGGGMQALQMLVDEHPEVMRFRMATVSEAMDEYLDDPAARALIALPGLYLGLPPSRLCFSVFAQHLFSHAVDGAGRVEGGIQRLVDAVIGALVKHGGELVTGRQVTRIGTSDGRATTVELDGELQIAAGSVVSNADPMRTYEELLGSPELPPGYRRKMRRLTPSDSTFNSYFATEAPLEDAAHSGYSVYYATGTDADAAWQASYEGRPGWAFASVPTLLGGREPGKPHQVITTVSAPYDAGRPWQEAEVEYAQAAMDILERVFPGASVDLVSGDFATPVETERFTLNHRGAQYGWGNGPDGVGSRALDQATPIENLFLAGGWTAPGSGFLRAAISGRLAALHIAGRAGVPLEVTW